MNKLVFATNNKNKLAEVARQLDGLFDIITLEELGCVEELEETSDTLEGNAWQKARYVAKTYGVDCFADDTGLEIEALNGEPGVYSARYAGAQKAADDNMDLVLTNLQGVSNRKAKFRTAIALIINNKEYLFEGEVQGKITTEKSGAKGFGYDPIFKPEESNKTFAEFTMEEKNKISHRGRAVAKLVAFLQSSF
jgi:XTP/dITP diphosphohydrolase